MPGYISYGKRQQSNWRERERQEKAKRAASWAKMQEQSRRAKGWS